MLSVPEMGTSKSKQTYDTGRDGFPDGGAGMLILRIRICQQRGQIYCELVDTEPVPMPSISSTLHRGSCPCGQDCRYDAGLIQKDRLHQYSWWLPPRQGYQWIEGIEIGFGRRIANHTSVSSTKSMTGHLLGAAAAIEAVFCVKALHLLHPAHH